MGGRSGCRSHGGNVKICISEREKRELGKCLIWKEDYFRGSHYGLCPFFRLRFVFLFVFSLSFS